MGAKTEIAWTTSTWNPITGCTRVSPGCVHCYAERFAHRFSGPGQRYEGLTVLANGHPSWTGKIQFNEEALLLPLRWKKPRMIFVNSMSDLFHENVTDEMRDRIFAVMALCPQHTFQVLTKRPERMLRYLTADRASLYERWLRRCGEIQRKSTQAGSILFETINERTAPPPNVWMGVSVENQAAADERIPLLLQTPAAKRFISAEPLLGPVTLFDASEGVLRGPAVIVSVGTTPSTPSQPPEGYDDSYSGLDWVICGGESGPGARPMHPDWARSLRDQCQAAGVPFFFKQWGAWLPSMQDGTPGDNQEINCSDQPVRVGKKAAGALLDGKQWHQFPETKVSL